MTIKRKPKRMSKSKRKTPQNTSRIFKSYRLKIDNRKKHLEDLIYIADNWNWRGDIGLGFDLDKKPSVIAKYRSELGIRRDTNTADQSKIDAIKEEYANLVKADKQEDGKRLEASRIAAREIKTKYRKKKAKLEKLTNTDGKTIKNSRDKIQALIVEITDLSRQLKKVKNKSDKEYNDQILKDLGLIP